MRPLFSAVVAAVTAIVLAACTSPPQGAAPSRPGDVVAWTQYGLGDTPVLIARALVGRADECPTVEWGGKAEAMTLRAPGRIEAFGKLCEKKMPLGDALQVRVRMGGAVLLEQQVTRRPERIAVLGDTGCRITYYADQGCNDQKTWPFASVAASVANQQPELILHLGDYYYREVPCLASNPDCTPGPYGDREQTWRVEFFEPARPLLARAPWVFARGNHEDCARGGYGWAYYFGEDPVACDVAHRAAFIRLDGLTVVNFDTAWTGNSFVAADLNKYWNGLATTLGGLRPGTPGQPILLMSHEPGYFICPDKKGTALQPCPQPLVDGIAGVRSIGDAARRSGWRTILLSGHIHAFRTIDVAPPSLGGPSVTQVVVGTSGANQNDDPTPTAMVPPAVVDARFPDPKDPAGVPIRVQGWTDFGFGMLSASTLQLAMFDAQGRPKFTCALAEETPPPRRCR
jgi:hypothetical protein